MGVQISARPRCVQIGITAHERKMRLMKPNIRDNRGRKTKAERNMADEPEFSKPLRAACNGPNCRVLEHFQAKRAPVRRQKVL